MKVLLINPSYGEDIIPSFPLGLAYVARVLLSAGIRVDVWDFNAPQVSISKAISRIRSASHYDLVGITGMIKNYGYIKGLVHAFKHYHPETKVILGGSLATAVSQYLMENLPLDFLVIGEGEKTATELASAIASGSALDSVPGISFRDEGKVVFTPPRRFIEDLDSIPFPAWDLFPVEFYRRNVFFDPDRSTKDRYVSGQMAIIGSRGCHYKCVYCDHNIKGNKIRFRSIDNLIAEIKEIYHRNKLNNFYFWDDIFTFSKKRVMEFCERVLKEDLKIFWTCNGHVNTADLEMFRKMKEAGCYSLRYGIESGSQRILDGLKKGVKVEQAIEAVRTTVDAGLTPVMYLMVGMFGEDEATIDDTINFFDEAFRQVSYWSVFPQVHFFYLTPIPGTPLFEEAVARGKIKGIKEFLGSRPDFTNKPVVNLTSLPIEKLIGLRKKLEQEIDRILMERYTNYHNTLSFLYSQLLRKKSSES
jgi:anaerobic magnesium-protoporphyrin IX monomethyl ester cyclase